DHTGGRGGISPTSPRSHATPSVFCFEGISLSSSTPTTGLRLLVVIVIIIIIIVPGEFVIIIIIIIVVIIIYCVVHVLVVIILYRGVALPIRNVGVLVVSPHSSHDF